MAGGISTGHSGNKIKGGKWTVIRFFSISLAFTVGWMTVSSQLSHFKLLYGPAILLQMNIAYFLPSLPLLVISSFLDDRLDRKFGVAKTILLRLLFGLGGCAIFTASWPFLPETRRILLVMVALLGMVAGIAFSAAYQLVAKFANKNTISLGLGCVGSGLVTLVIEAVFQIKASPTHIQEIILYEITAGVIVVGGVSAISLLIRHWKSVDGTKGIEAKEEIGIESQAPLLEPLSPAREEFLKSQPRISKTFSRMIKYTPMDPFDTMSDPERVDDDEEDVVLALRSLFRQSTFKAENSWSANSPRAVNIFAFSDDSQHPADSEESSSSQIPDPQPVGLIRVMALTWPIMGALFIAGNILCILFPFFTFIPSSSQHLKQTLPQVLFFVRLFGDILGRTIPRQKSLAMRSQRWLFTIAVVLACTVPFFFVYIKSSWHSDALSIGYIVIVWLGLGYVNTCAYMLAPQKVPLHAKSTANGALAIMYQGSHMMGLLIALILTLALYGGFTV